MNVLLEYGNFTRGIATIWEEYQDEKNWELYLSLNPWNEKNFKEWKEEGREKQNAQKPMSKAEVCATVEKSQNLLKGFKPPKE